MTGSIPFGYLDRWTARPGESLEVKVSSQDSYRLSVVRLVQGDVSDAGPGHREVAQDWWQGRRYPALVQPVSPGSRAVSGKLAILAQARRVVLDIIFQPGTLTLGSPQVIAALLTADGQPSLALAITEDGECELRLRASQPVRPAGAQRLRTGRWYRARVSADLDARLAEFEVTSLDHAPSGPQHLAAGTPLEHWLGPERLVLAAETDAGGADFTGKLEAPVLSAWGPAASGTVSWCLGPARGSVIEDDEGSDAVLHLVNTPMTAVTGHRWDGTVLDFRRDPGHYAALAFHADDLTDAGWQSVATIQLPPELASGVYAVKLSAAGGDRYVPFFVVPASPGSAAGSPRNRIAVLLPTFTYLAYANEHVREGVRDFDGIATWPSRQDLEISAHRDFGLSLYDRHADDTGVCYSSLLRPVLNFDPSYRFWLFNGPVHLGEDLYLLDWLERLGHGYDILTDHLVHSEGAAALDGYAVVLTGSHPEYSSGALLDALQTHVDRGGKLMYLGGNGFYWVTSVDPAAPHIIEIRRGTAGSRVWESVPGEGYHSTTGEPGGLWRYRGRPPNRLFGVGFAAQGADQNAPGYRRVLPAEPGSEWDFVFAGIPAEEIIGENGLLLGGGAGNEIDRADTGLGTPAETVVLATSTGHSDAYQLTLEDLLLNAPGQGGTEQPLVRSDITITPYASGGCVFSVGAITWLGAVAWNRYDNAAARLTRNVLERFLDPPALGGRRERPAEHVGANPGQVVAAVTDREAAAGGYRAEAENDSAGRRHPDRHIAPDQRVGRAADAVFVRAEELAAFRIGAGQHRAPGRGERLVVTVEFNGHGTTGVEALGADEIGIGTVENPGEFRLAGCLGPPVGQAAVPAEAGEPDSHQRIRRTPLSPPDSAGLILERVPGFAGFRRPGLRTAGPPHLEQVRPGRMHGRDPVEAVPAQVHDAAAAVDERFERVEHGPGPVLRVAGQHQGPAARQGGLAASVQGGVGQHAIGRAGLLQPPVHVEVSHQQVRDPFLWYHGFLRHHVGAGERVEAVNLEPGARLQRRHGLQPRAHVHRRAIPVQGVVGQAGITRRVASQVSVRLPGEGRCQQQDRRIGGGLHHEREISPPVPIGCPDDVNTAPRVGRHGDPVGRRPAAIVEVVAMKVHRVVSGNRSGHAYPWRPGHPEGRRVDQPAMPVMAGYIGDLIQVAGRSENPLCQHGIRPGARQRAPVHDVHQRDRVRAARDQARRRYLAIQRWLRQCWLHQPAEGQRRPGSRPGRPADPAGQQVRSAGAPGLAPGQQRAVIATEAGGEEVPHALAQVVR
jgi:N,N-dimethylformamidase